MRYFAFILVLQSLDGEERAGCFALRVFLVFRDCYVALPHDATDLSAVCNCGISGSYSITIFVYVLLPLQSTIPQLI